MPTQGAFPTCSPNTWHKVRKAQLPSGNAWRISQGKPHPNQPEESRENCAGKPNFLHKTQPLPIPPQEKLLQTHWGTRSAPGQVSRKPKMPWEQVHRDSRRILLLPAACERHFSSPGEILHEFGPQNVKRSHQSLACGGPHLMSFPCFPLPCLLGIDQRPRRTETCLFLKISGELLLSR